MRDSPIYLDYNATTPIAGPVLDCLTDSLNKTFGNASSAHSYGVDAKSTLENARAQVAACLGANPAEILFTSGGTESDNLALIGTSLLTPSNKRHLVTTQIEHPAIEETCAYLETKGFVVERVPCQADGRVKAQDILKAITPSTFLVTVMLANNETGALQPLAEVGAHCRQNGVLLHTDAAQAVGKIPVDVGELQVDLLTVAGHKLYAPKGVGALYVRQGTPLAPLQFGGGHESGLRPGTENVPLIAALGKAAELAQLEMGQRVTHARDLCTRLRQRLEQALGSVALNGPEIDRLPNTLNITIPGIRATDLIGRLEGVALSAGSACHTGLAKPSPVLTAMGLPESHALGALRISVGRESTEADIDQASDALILAAKACLAEA